MNEQLKLGMDDKTSHSFVDVITYPCQNSKADQANPC